jgi:hypothetical protein
MQQVIDRKRYGSDQAEQGTRSAPLTDSVDDNYLTEPMYKNTNSGIVVEEFGHLVET